MGTNYYLREKIKKGLFKSETKETHIGKSSCGWCFALHVYPAEGINTLQDWERKIQDSKGKVFNEYGDKVPTLDLMATICDRSFPEPLGQRVSEYFAHPMTKEAFLQMNHAEEGPNNLLRHRVGGFCVGHGEGTWDYLDGDFS